jgi:hypothetical protein
MGYPQAVDNRESYPQKLSTGVDKVVDKLSTGFIHRRSGYPQGLSTGVDKVVDSILTM